MAPEVEVDSRIQADPPTDHDASASIGEYRMEINMSSVAYNVTTERLRDRGYNTSEPLKDALLTDLDVYGGAVEGTWRYRVTPPDSYRVVVLTVTDFRPPTDGNVTLTETGDGRLVYRDRMLTNSTELGEVLLSNNRTLGSVDYTVEMPYEVRGSNADVVNGRTARWNRTLVNESLRIRAESRILRSPEARFSVDVSRTGSGVRFDASDSTDDLGVVAYEWEFGDGSTATGETVFHEYDETGEYTVTLVVTDGDGLNSTAKEPVRVIVDDGNGGDTGTWDGSDTDGGNSGDTSSGDGGGTDPGNGGELRYTLELFAAGATIVASLIAIMQYFRRR